MNIIKGFALSVGFCNEVKCQQKWVSVTLDETQFRKSFLAVLREKLATTSRRCRPLEREAAFDTVLRLS